MTPKEACSILLEAVELHAPCDDTGRAAALAWCEARAKKLATSEGEDHVNLLRARILKTGGSWIPGMANVRPGGQVDVRGIASIVEAYQSATPICSPDDSP